MSAQTPGTRLSIGHEAPLTNRSPRPAASSSESSCSRRKPPETTAFPVPLRCLADPARQVKQRVKSSYCARGGGCAAIRKKLTQQLALYRRILNGEVR